MLLILDFYTEEAENKKITLCLDGFIAASVFSRHASTGAVFKPGFLPDYR